ncbi:DNA-binding response regulator [Acuticoccus sediminis]|uniref:DNA-binding response regulator n=1 Tax=Acuticoccus sediminis TaxID=2184697 RepID=A0A8B2NSQ8_9HYPH|nr:response regulator [Acuticoccus sediminis]RAI03257.1 DNA-binding response regulator [Acuticoccus sediminis]
MRTPQGASGPLVVVVDDDEGMQMALADLLKSVEMNVRCYTSVDELFAVGVEGVNCMILDVRLPGQSGLELQERLHQMGSRVPVIFVTGFGDVPMGVRAMKGGAVDFLTKPFRNQELIDAVNEALRKDAEQRRTTGAADAVVKLAESLTPREREVMNLVWKGLMNKQIAYELGIAEITVKIHRRNVMQKMEATSVAELVRKADLVKSHEDEKARRDTAPYTQGRW